jgi:hypothetical protein
MARLPLSLEDYKACKIALSSENQFVVLPGHELDVDCVVERHATHLIIETQHPADGTAGDPPSSPLLVRASTSPRPGITQGHARQRHA